jgi:hypothetical protein
LPHPVSLTAIREISLSISFRRAGGVIVDAYSDAGVDPAGAYVMNVDAAFVVPVPDSVPAEGHTRGFR